MFEDLSDVKRKRGKFHANRCFFCSLLTDWCGRAAAILQKGGHSETVNEMFSKLYLCKCQEIVPF